MEIGKWSVIRIIKQSLLYGWRGIGNTMRYYIKEAEDFGLTFNMVIRMYMRHYDKDILELAVRICDVYICYFSSRTVIVALRDMLESRWLFNYSGDYTIPSDQEDMFEHLLRKLTRQIISLDVIKNRREFSDWDMCQLCRDVTFVRTYDTEKPARFANYDAAIEWMKSNNLKEPSRCYVKDKIPIKKIFFEDFGRACYWLVTYAYGRHTYMPTVANSFIRTNISLIKNNELICIRDTIANVEEDGKNVDSLLDYSNDSVWISLREFLNREIALRN